MTRKTKTRRKTAQKPAREQKPWESSANEEVNLYLPSHFRMLCDLMGVPMKKVIEDFITTLSGAYSSLGKEHHAKLEEYFELAGYGCKRYTPDEIRQMLYELQAIYRLWPGSADSNFINVHAFWRDAYKKYWYEKWKRVREITPHDSDYALLSSRVANPEME